MSLTQSIETLKAMRAKIAALETSVGSEISRELASLPAKYGFETPEAFIEAVRSSLGAGPKRRGRPPKASAGKKARAEKEAGNGRRKRATITPAMRDEVAKRAKAGETAAVIAKAVGISLPSVQNIKKAAGLVKGRGSKGKVKD